MSRRLNPNPPRSPREVEEFFLRVGEKLGGTDATLADVDQRSIMPIHGRVNELADQIAALQATVASLRCRYNELENLIEDLKRSARR